MNASLAAAAAALLVAGVLVWVFLASRPEVERRVAGISVQGRPMSYQVHGSGGRTVFFLASIHGSEGAGTPLLEELGRRLERDPGLRRGQRVIVMPVANPDGLARGDRLNVHGVDLNRNFPAGNHKSRERYGLEPLSEPESRALHALILEWRPEVIVSIHQPLECVDWDGPPETAALAERMSRACGLPVKKLGARPGSLGAWFSEVPGKPIVTFELPKTPPVEKEALWEAYGAALLTVLEKDSSE